MSKIKEEHIAHWTASAENDWDTVIVLMDSKKWVHALFFCHLCLEKYCKAIWILNNEENVPPKIHNLLKILDLSKITYDEFAEGLIELNEYQIEGRYTSELTNLYSLTTEKRAKNNFEKSKKIKEWLIEKLV